MSAHVYYHSLTYITLDLIMSDIIESCVRSGDQYQKNNRISIGDMQFVDIIAIYKMLVYISSLPIVSSRHPSTHASNALLSERRFVYFTIVFFRCVSTLETKKQWLVGRIWLIFVSRNDWSDRKLFLAWLTQTRKLRIQHDFVIATWKSSIC